MLHSKRTVAKINYGSISLAKLLLLNDFARFKYIFPIERNSYYYPDINYYNQLIEVEQYAKVNKVSTWSLSFQEHKIFSPK